ncbi:MAG TPA: hypothetical protein DD706_05500 [Nitrospiraceae bacterium]|nr:hypothetical protein [Nitrospiraceae bacterium]
MMFCIAGSRPGSRAPFVSAKGAKTIDAPSGLIRPNGCQPVEADQLAEFILSHVEGLKQGSLAHESVHLEGRTAGVGTGETNLSRTHMKERGTLYTEVVKFHER